MNKQLKAKTQQWMSLERKTLEQRKLADEFYDSELMNLIVSEYIANNKKSVLEKVDYLVVSVGTAYEPLVLNEYSGGRIPPIRDRIPANRAMIPKSF